METKTELVVSRTACAGGMFIWCVGTHWAATLEDPNLAAGLIVFFICVAAMTLVSALVCDGLMLVRYYRANPHELGLGRKPSSLAQQQQSSSAEK